MRKHAQSLAVFLGPTLPSAEARRILDATYLPPAAEGDVCALVDERPAAIAIIDGYFEQVPSVRHKEILYALSRGIPVFGASSMGALRAAELHAFGMEGRGAVFEAFRDGELEDDDEVAVLHAPASAGFRATSEAMVNLRYGMRRACDAGLVDGEGAARMVALAKALHYSERSWPALFRSAREAGVAGSIVDGIERFVARERPNRKAEDARALLVELARLRKDGIAPHQPSFDFEPSYLFLQMDALARVRRLAGGDAVRLHRIGRWARIFGSGALERLRAARLLGLADHLGRVHALAPPPPDARGVLDELEHAQHALGGLVDLDAMAVVDLARRGELEAATRAVDRRDAAMGSPPARKRRSPSAAQLLRWYRARAGFHFDSLADCAGLLELDPDLLEAELRAEYLAEHSHEAGTISA
jgi:hypothetical protein